MAKPPQSKDEGGGSEPDGDPQSDGTAKKRGGKVVKAKGKLPRHRLDKMSRGGGKWMQGLHLKEGAMTKAAKREGLSNAAYEHKHKGDSGKAGKRARLALTFAKADHKK